MSVVVLRCDGSAAIGMGRRALDEAFAHVEGRQKWRCGSHSLACAAHKIGVEWLGKPCVGHGGLRIYMSMSYNISRVYGIT